MCLTFLSLKLGAKFMVIWHIRLIDTKLSLEYFPILKTGAVDLFETLVSLEHIIRFDVFSTVHHSIELFHQPTLMHNFLYSLTVCLLHYYSRHISSINMPIFRRKNCIHTASGIFAVCKRLHSTLVESGLNQCTV